MFKRVMQTMICACFISMVSLWSVAASALEEGGEGKAKTGVIPIFSAEYWPGYTNQDGTGLYWTLLNQVLNAEEIFYKPAIFDTVSGLEQLNDGMVKAVVGVFKTPQRQQQFLFPSVRLDNEVNTLFSKTGVPYKDVSSFDGKRVGVEQGLTYDEEILGHAAIVTYPTTKELLTGLVMGDVAFVFATKYDFLAELKKAQYELDKFEQHDLVQVPLYVIFAKTPEGEQLAHHFESGMKKAYKSGKLKEQFTLYNSSDSFYFPELDIASESETDAK